MGYDVSQVVGPPGMLELERMNAIPASIFTLIVGILTRVSGDVASEINFKELAAAITTGALANESDKVAGAIQQIVADKDKVFLHDNWFKGLAVSTLNIVLSLHVL